MRISFLFPVLPCFVSRTLNDVLIVSSFWGLNTDHTVQKVNLCSAFCLNTPTLSFVTNNDVNCSSSETFFPFQIPFGVKVERPTNEDMVSDLEGSEQIRINTTEALCKCSTLGSNALDQESNFFLSLLKANMNLCGLNVS